MPLTEKYCAKCGVRQTEENSNIAQRYGKVYWASYCRKCRNQYNKDIYYGDDEHYASHASNKSLAGFKYRETHKEQLKKSKQEYQARRHAEKQAYDKEYYAKHREEKRAYDKEYRKRKRKEVNDDD